MNTLSKIYCFFKRIPNIRLMMKDRSVSLWKKALIVFGIIYLFLPFEVIPDFFLPVGIIDDIVLWGSIITLLGDTLDKYNSPNKKARKKYKGKTVIDDVEFEIKEEEDETGNPNNS